MVLKEKMPTITADIAATREPANGATRRYSSNGTSAFAVAWTTSGTQMRSPTTR